jgi:predicted amidohydrolase YtcJ
VQVIDCHGGQIVPGFFDCHLHLTATGLLTGDHDLGPCRSVPAMLSRLRALAQSEELVYAGNVDETTTDDKRLPTRQELDAVTAGRPALVSRIDGHSCIANSAALSHLGIDTRAEGVDRDLSGEPTGVLRGPLSYGAQADFVHGLPRRSLRRADRAAAHAALAAGITTLHNVIEGERSYEELAEIYIDNAVLPLHVVSKSCTASVEKARRLGGKIFGGDIFVDGSIGSRTAAVSNSYADGSGKGLLYLDREELASLFEEAAEAGLSPGVHAIGDVAIEQAIAAWESVARKRGSLEGLRPSIDHFEIARPDHIERASRIGLFLSMQPAFDHLWGGKRGMYEQRLGADRAESMNLFKTARRKGCMVCGGSDSPVTTMSALLGIHSLVNHHIPDERMTVDEALRIYTCDAARLSYAEESTGRLRPGMAADVAVLDKRIEDVPPEVIKDMRVMLTCVDGEIRFGVA